MKIGARMYTPGMYMSHISRLVEFPTRNTLIPHFSQRHSLTGRSCQMYNTYSTVTVMNSDSLSFSS